ncbi:hypothetical protein [Limnoglobus roseus]|uniref:hypothetical protein n=1 Tax=Limnoglobus roseus TaxID=2598579 RepID=UPI0011EB6FAC|nr:hypothetical protein [Limnoglobus roseus]
MLRFLLLPALFSLSCLPGCGPTPTSNVPTAACYPARGQLTVAGKPAVGATIILVPANATDARPRATVGPEGKFTLSTFATNDGAPAGEYGLIVFWKGAEVDDQLNGRYSTPEKTNQKVTIADGKPELPPIQLK